MVDVELKIIREAVLRIVLFNEVGAKSKFQKEINCEFDEGFADNWTVLVRALDQRPPSGSGSATACTQRQAGRLLRLP